MTQRARRSRRSITSWKSRLRKTLRRARSHVRRRTGRRSRAALLAASPSPAGLLLCAAAASAQAWVPAQGEGAVSVLYQDLFVKDHFLAGGGRSIAVTSAPTTCSSISTYGITDELTVALGVPFVRARYSGAFPHPTPQDNGGRTVDFRTCGSARDTSSLTDAVDDHAVHRHHDAQHGYEYFAHAAYGHARPRARGRLVHRSMIGARPARRVRAGALLVRLRGADRRHQPRSQQPRRRGRVFRPPIAARLRARRRQKTHGGIDTPDAGWRAMPAALAPHHDRIARLEMLDVGGGAQLSLTESIDLFGSFVTTVAGRNSHALARGLTFGASWGFGRSARPDRSAGRPLPATRPKRSCPAVSVRSSANHTKPHRNLTASPRLPLR